MSIIGRIIRRKEKKYQPWHGFLMLAVVFIAVFLGVMQRLTQNRVDDEIKPVQAILSEETCGLSGGVWDECGSACRGSDGTPCIEVCVPYCECASDNECPFASFCNKYIDDVGVCSDFSLK